MLYIAEHAREKVGMAKEWSKQLDWFFVEPERIEIRQRYEELLKEDPDWKPPTWTDVPYNPDDTVEAWVQEYIAYKAPRNANFQSFDWALDYVGNWGTNDERRSFAYLMTDFTDYGFIANVYLEGKLRNPDPRYTPDSNIAMLIADEYRLTYDEALNGWHHAITMGVIYHGPKRQEIATYNPTIWWGWSIHT